MCLVSERKPRAVVVPVRTLQPMRAEVSDCRHVFCQVSLTVVRCGKFLMLHWREYTCNDHLSTTSIGIWCVCHYCTEFDSADSCAVAM